jgi:uncharacterized lipoprotein
MNFLNPRPRLTLLVCVSAATLSACSLFKRDAAYADSREAGRLEVPEQLDRPSADPSLALPQGGTGGVLLDEESQKPPELGQRTTGVGGSVAASDGFELDQPSTDVYGRIGTELEGMSEFTIRSRDPILGVYRLQFEAPAPARRWWKFWSAPKPVRAELLVRVTRTTGGSIVSVDAMGGGAAAARAQQLRETLKARLAG